MKYMGSKRRMLENRLGELICRQSRHASRIVDLFCGAGSVSWYAAQNTDRKVLAADLQAYAVTMARAVIERDAPLNAQDLSRQWLSRVRRARSRSRLLGPAIEFQHHSDDIKTLVRGARALCGKKRSRARPVWTAYGGYYFSPFQALTFDCMLRHLPQHEPHRSVCLAATISAASGCAASPGHTAQPFRPTPTAAPFLVHAWSRDPLEYAEKALHQICPLHASVVGHAVVSDAIELAGQLGRTDLVIVDPPYSGVQYSRFYHVLETIARGRCGSVSGAGRYPPVLERPQSEFSKKSTSRQALSALFNALSCAGATVIVTFPAGECSNGLSGAVVTDIAKSWFAVDEQVVDGEFSTLGGNNAHRASRKASSELLLLLRSRG